MAKKAFGELESQILLTLKSGKRKTVKQVFKELGEKGSYNTIMTVMSRLAEKKVLVREKVGLQYEYWIDDTSTYFLNKVKSSLGGIKAPVLVAHLLESSDDISDEELEAMEKIIQKKREKIMVDNPFFFLSLLTGSLLAFFSSVLLVQISTIVFRIKNPKIRAYLRLFPFLTTITALFLIPFDFNFMHLPFLCKNCVQKFFVNTFLPHLKTLQLTDKKAVIQAITPAKLPHLYSFIFFGGLALSFALLVKGLVKLVFEKKYLNTLLNSSEKFGTPFLSTDLKTALKKKRVKLLLSEKISVPIATHTNFIFLPKKLISKLNEQEIESIIAHELEHIKSKDPLTRSIYYVLSKILWWIPSKRWVKTIENDQELNSDSSIKTYGISQESLASALIKTAKFKKAEALSASCLFTGYQGLLKTRLNTLLELGTPKEKVLGYGVLYTAIAAIISIACVFIFK